MEESKLGVIETRFAKLIWENAPLSSGELVKLCEKHLGWKKSTTYTVLKKLSARGLFENKDGMVYILQSESDYYATQSEQFVKEAFAGSLPAFLAAFTKRKSLSQDEVKEIRRMMDAYQEDL